MKYLLSLLILTSISFADNITNSDWWEHDKQLHAKYSMVIGGASTSIARYYGYSRTESFLIGIGTTLIIGVGKEIYDGQHVNHTADVNDVKADMVGGVIGSVIATSFTWNF